jgi:hypothetical protein
MSKIVVPALLLGLASLTHAARPLTTEDAGVLAAHAREWDSSVAQLRTRGSATQNAWSTQIGCGIGFDTQVALAYSGAESDGEHAYGLTLGGKTGLADGGDAIASWAVAWGATFVRQGDLPLYWDAAYLNLVFSKPLSESLTLHANFGWLHSHVEHHDRATWNLAGEYALTPQLDATAEIYGYGSQRPWLAAGLRLAASQSISLNASYALQRGRERTGLLTLGLVFAF